MANFCLQLCGFLLSSLGWIGIMIATSTSDWVIRCKYGMNTCKKMDELNSKGPWEECIISTALTHCSAYTQVLELPAYIQATRALMVIASILGLPAVGLLVMSLPCISLGNEAQSSKNKRVVFGGVLMIIVALCAIVPTIWFPIGANNEVPLMYFGFSLFTGWVGTVFCLLGGVMLMCSSDSSTSSSRTYQDNNHFYYSKQGGVNQPAASSNNHAKSAHV
ncbi:claudin-11a [Cyprinodon tularosa]|uniref:Claudin-11 n=1 Tax=Cyprinodon variegatus TaxID=28743 RepID=A0A3Q2FW79_CYPVA|nr:PREDICTED: claudin-11-like [Cyprinodon variegatus]XP_038148257.1 claudin-11a [Cyprinodon tularosa]